MGQSQIHEATSPVGSVHKMLETCFKVRLAIGLGYTVSQCLKAPCSLQTDSVSLNSWTSPSRPQ